MEKTRKISWKDIIQWEVISILVNEAFDGEIEINEEIKQESLQKFEELHSEEEINEMDFDDIEDEMIDILIDILDDGTMKGKGKEVLIEIKGDSKLNDLNYLAKLMEQNPNLKRVFQKVKKKNIDDDEDDNKFNMYIKLISPALRAYSSEKSPKRFLFSSLGTGIVFFYKFIFFQLELFQYHR